MLLAMLKVLLDVKERLLVRAVIDQHQSVHWPVIEPFVTRLQTFLPRRVPDQVPVMIIGLIVLVLD